MLINNPGMRRTVEGIMVVHEHGHPHILMLQIANAFFKLPGDYLTPGETDEPGLKKRLDDRLAPLDPTMFEPEEGALNDWEIGDCLAQWWRPNFETFMVSCGNAKQLRLTRSSIHLFLHTSQNQKSAKRCM